MKIRKVLFAFFILIAIVAAFISTMSRVTHAQSGASDSEVIAKLDEVLSSQKAMMEILASLKEDLRIIQVRVTQSQ